MHIFDQIAHGPELLALFDRAIPAGGSAHRDPAPAEEIAQHPRAGEVLPMFGMSRIAITTQATERRPSRQIPAWQGGSYPFPHFWQKFRDVAGAIETTANDQGIITQRITADAALAFWHTCVQLHWRQNPPPEDHAPYHFAVALARQGGIPWQRDGDTLMRVLPQQPLRLVPTEGGNPRSMQSADAVVVPCVGYAYLPANSRHNDEPENALVYVSGVGSHKKLRAFVAALQSNNRKPCLLPAWETHYSGTRDIWARARRPEGKGIYATFWNDEPLAESGFAHLVVQHYSALAPRALTPFLHLTGADGHPDLDRFFRQLDVASPYPIKRAWAQRLWDAGIAAKLITKLPSYGCAAFWCDPTDERAWATMVAACQGAAAATIESFGEETNTDDLSTLVVPVDTTI